MLNTILNIASFVLAVLGFVFTLVQGRKADTTVEKTIVVNLNSYENIKNTKTNRSNYHNHDTFCEFIVILFLLISFSYVYMTFESVLKISTTVTSIILTAILTFFGQKYSTTAKEGLRNYYILSQTFLFETVATLYLNFLHIDTNIFESLKTDTWMDSFGQILAHIVEPQMISVMFLYAFSALFYIFEILALLLLMIRIIIMLYDFENKFIYRLAVSPIVFMPSFIIVFILFFMLYFHFIK